MKKITKNRIMAIGLIGLIGLIGHIASLNAADQAAVPPASPDTAGVSAAVNTPIAAVSEKPAPMSQDGIQVSVKKNLQSPGGVDKYISMDFQDVPLKQVLKAFSQQTGMNFVSSEGVQERKVTLFLDNVIFQDALNTILGANNLTYEQQPGTNIYMVKDIKAPPTVVETRIYKLSYATVSGSDIGEGKGSGIETILSGMLSDKGKIIVDPRTNSVLITDTPTALAQVENILKELDVKPAQVMISAEILEVSIDTLKRLGVEWGTDSGVLVNYSGGTRSTFWPFKPSLFKGTTPDNTMGTVSFSSMAAVLKAIKTDSSTQYLARPRLLTINNKTAEIKITRNAAVASTTVTTAGEGLTQATEKLERYEVGTILKVTPHINKDDYITMTVEPEVSRVQVSNLSTSSFDPFKRSAKTTVMVKDSDTVVIAGLISREDLDSNRKVPILGNLPLVGNFFNRDEKSRANTEVLILLTPRIIKDGTAAFETAMREEMELYASPGVRPQDRELLKNKESRRRTKKRRNVNWKDEIAFQKMPREQDLPLSGREVMIESEMLKIKSTHTVANK